MARQRLFWPATAALLGFLATVQILSALRESTTADEPAELAAGYSYLKTGDFRLNSEHPPLSKMIAALPLLGFGLVFPTDRTAWSTADDYVFGGAFFHDNAPQLDALLFAARLTAIFLTFCLGLAIALWARANFGPFAALLAVTLYAFDPAITAHGRYVKNDVPLTLFAFLACIAWAAYLSRPGIRRLVLAGLALGLAMATKFSALFLLPVFALLLAVRYWQAPANLSPWRALRALLAAVALAAGVVVLIYAIPAWMHGAKLGGLASHPFLQGLRFSLRHNSAGHPAYLLGMHGMKGWWFYFPIAFAVKMPVATLLFLALAACAGLWMLRSAPIRSASLSWFVLVVPLVVYGAFSLTSHLNIGIRHILPMWPFLFILSAAIFARARFRYAPAILLLLGAALVTESVSIYPHYLAFFNVLAGGPAQGARILADSNLDWGQDAKQLRDWLRVHPTSHLCIDYFGEADLNRLGIAAPSLAARWNHDRRISLDCVEAISVNFLEGVYASPGDFAWLRDLQPDARIGYSIYIYDLPKRAMLGQLPLQHFTATPKFVDVRHPDFRGPPTAADPARRGEILAFLMTGLGPMYPRIPIEKTAPANRLSYTELPLFCQWNASAGGPFAEVLYSGSSPPRTGAVYQANIRVPPGIPSAQLTCTSALFSGGQSQPASIEVPLER
jgi:hypothetical protein